MMALAFIAALLRLDPHPAVDVAARATGLHRFTTEVHALVDAESRGRRVGVHTGHAPRVPGRVFWRAAVARRWIDLGGCEHHTPGDDGAAGWGIRGPLGLAAAYSVRHLGTCVAAEAVDVPYLAAVVALRRLRDMERTYGLRTPEARALAWRVGVGEARRVTRRHGTNPT